MSKRPVLRVGCAMWAYKVWQGLHFPDPLPRQDQMRVYASWCNTVEGNTTFYGLPAARTVTGAGSEVPERFRFVFKLPKVITHDHHLRDVAADHRAFLQRLAPLGDRAEQFFIELPPSFGRRPTSAPSLHSSPRRPHLDIVTPSSCAIAPSTTTPSLSDASSAF